MNEKKFDGSRARQTKQSQHRRWWTRDNEKTKNKIRVFFFLSYNLKDSVKEAMKN